MALPNQFDNATPAGSALPSTIDNQLRDLKLAIEDIFGVPNATNISAAGLNYVAAGLDRVIFQDAAGNPTAAGRLQRNASNLAFHDGTASRNTVFDTATQTLTNKTLTSPIVGTQITLDQTTADYTLTWADPSAGRAISIPDPGGTDVFAFRDMTQTLINKTINLTSNTLTGTLAQFNTAVSNADLSPVLAGYLFGLTLSNNGVDATNDINLAVGAAASDDVATANRRLMELTSVLVKQIDAAWAVGTNQGGMDTGAVANDTWYHVWLIMRSDTGVVDALFSLSATAPTMPASYDFKRRLGSVRRLTAANKAFSQNGDEFLWNASILDIDAANPGTAAVLRTLTVPSGIKVTALTNTVIDIGTAETVVYFSSPDVDDEAPSRTLAPLGTLGSVGIGATSEEQIPSGVQRTRTNTVSQIRSRLSASTATTTLRIATLGWIDQRGRND